MKRLLSLLICLTLVASSLGMVTFAKDSDHWAYETVKGLVSDGIVSGDSEGNLNLDKSITRAEFIKTINKYFGLTKKADANYPDVASDKWYYNDLLIAKGEGYILGVGAKIFTVAGPVILYGITAGAVYGVIYWITTLF